MGTGAGMNKVGLVVYPASDVPRATKLFASWLGTEPYAESQYYVGFKVEDLEIGIVPEAAQRGLSGALAYVDVSDIKEALATLLAAGAEKVRDVTDVSNGLLIAVVKDFDGTPIGLRQFPSG
jgi:predicted enzyme related to lactoylglutathione lyase